MINLLVVLSADHSFMVVDSQMRPWVFLAFGFVSLMATFKFLTNTKTYQVFNFESMYFQMGGYHSLKDIRDSNPKRFYNQIDQFFHKQFPNTSFAFKKMKRDKTQQFEIASDDFNFSKLIQDYILHPLKKTCKKIGKTITPSFLFKQLSNEDKFYSVRNDPEYVQYLEAEVWEHNEIFELYFIYVNPIFVLSAFYNGWQIVLIDIVCLVLIDLISDKARSQIVGERLIQSVLRTEEKRAES